MILQHPEPYSRRNPDITQKIPAISREFLKSSTPNLPPLGTRDWRPPLYWNNPLPALKDDEKFEQKCKRWFANIMIALLLIAILLLTAIVLTKMLIFEIKA